MSKGIPGSHLNNPMNACVWKEECIARCEKVAALQAKYTTLLERVREHNEGCDQACRNNITLDRCGSYQMIGRTCPDCPAGYLITIDDLENSDGS